MKKLLAVFLATALMISACESNITPKPKVVVGTVQSRVEVEWVEITPPPGEDGPCYAYFEAMQSGYQGYGYSGVYCK